MKSYEKFLNTLLASRIQRWHTIPNLNQTVGEHTYGVLVILTRFMNEAPRVFTEDDKLKIYQVALTHDAPELFTGDIPAPVRLKLENMLEFEYLDKNAKEKVIHYSPENSFIRCIVYLADKLDAYLFASHNNQNMDVAFNNRRVIEDFIKQNREIIPDRIIMLVGEILQKGWYAL
jgi:5'-deoxynucleotidase YfbR-like HD superfamily hydrolase